MRYDDEQQQNNTHTQITGGTVALKKYLKSRMPQDQVKKEIEEEDPITIATRNLCRGDADGVLRLSDEAFQSDFRIEERYLSKIRGVSISCKSVVNNLSHLHKSLIEMKSLESLDFSSTRFECAR